MKSHFLKVCSLFALVACLACHKTRTCTQLRAKLPGAIAFVGFPADELDSFVLRRYQAGSNFGQFLRSDTVRFSRVQIQNDTASDGGRGLLSYFGDDLELFVPAAARSYRLSALCYYGDSVYSFTTDQAACPTRGSALWQPDSVTLNGQRYKLVQGVGMSRLIFLHK